MQRINYKRWLCIRDAQILKILRSSIEQIEKFAIHLLRMSKIRNLTSFIDIMFAKVFPLLITFHTPPANILSFGVGTFI